MTPTLSTTTTFENSITEEFKHLTLPKIISKTGLNKELCFSIDVCPRGKLITCIDPLSKEQLHNPSEPTLKMKRWLKRGHFLRKHPRTIIAIIITFTAEDCVLFLFPLLLFFVSAFLLANIYLGSFAIFSSADFIFCKIRLSFDSM